MVVYRDGIMIVARLGDASGEGGVLLAGDSLMFQYGPRIEALYRQHRLKTTVYFVIGPSCVPIPGVLRGGSFKPCSRMPGVMAELIAAKHIHTVVLGGVSGPASTARMCRWSAARFAGRSITLRHWPMCTLIFGTKWRV